LQARKIKDTSILLFQRDVGGLGLVNPGDLKGTGRLRQQLDARTGVLQFQTDHRDAGLLEVCVQSFSAKHDAPSRVSVLVRRKSESRVGGITSSGEEDVRKLSMLSNVISADLTRFEQRARELGANSDQARDQEKEFHGQSIKLNRAVKYWPIFRMVVLVVGGYAQVTHVVRFMKSRHIY
jgi:emp24/gp25L/p24 family/GOLD